MHQLEWLSHLQQSPVPVHFLLPDVVIATDAIPSHCTFYFQVSRLSLSVSGSWSGFMCKAHIALWELQAVAMMLHRMAFQLSGKVVALHLDNNTAKAYLCNQGGVVSPVLSILSCQILKFDWQAQYESCSSIHSCPSECGNQLPVLGTVASRVASSSSHCWCSTSSFGSTKMDLLASSHTNQCQHCCILESPLLLGALGLNAFNHPCTFQVSFLFSAPALLPLVLSKFLLEHVTV